MKQLESDFDRAVKAFVAGTENEKTKRI